MTDTVWTTNCRNCSKPLERDDLRGVPKPGTLLAFLCKACGSITAGKVEGAARYRQPKTEHLYLAVLQAFQRQGPPMTVRGMYYALEVAGYVPKTDAGYQKTVRTLLNMRRAGTIPYGWLVDSARWMRKPKTYQGLRAALENTRATYRRDLWENQKTYIEIWCEKDALAGVIYPITSEYAVPLMVAKGFSSETFLYESAEAMRDLGKPVFIYHLGDLDPSGVCAYEKIQEGLTRHGVNATYERLAVTREQVETLKLSTRPNKKKDTRLAGWNLPYSCELDALPVDILRGLVRDCIERHIDPVMLAKTQETERLERATLAQVLGNSYLDTEF